jgi:hypothetical protein
MKLGKTVLLEIMDIVRKGLAEGIDVSQALREIDVHTVDADSGSYAGTVELSTAYVETHPRAKDAAWKE